MELIDSKKLEAIANFIGEAEVEGNCVCDDFNEALKENRIGVPCDAYSCEGNCPFYSKENFMRWVKKPYKKLDVEDLKKPKQEDFIGFDNRSGMFALSGDYVQALEKYCNGLENALTYTEYDNRKLADKLEKIRGVIDGSH